MWSVGAPPGKGLLQRVVFKEKTLKHQQKNMCVRQCDPPNARGRGPSSLGNLMLAGPWTHRENRLALGQRENLHQGYQVTGK